MISIERLSKRFGDFTAVDDVSFTAPSGQVTGFLGPNGAGKSTTLRILTGLSRADHGSATIGGRRFAELANPGREVGCLLDASAQHAGRTGREILTIAARTMGLPVTRVDEMLATVGLEPHEARRRVGKYSLGMRQRLGIAHALIGQPSVLILDEPVNGLDPAGIRWMRGLLRDFADGGGTVLLSSHLLHEVQQVADSMVVIGRGRIVAAGTKDELLVGAGTFVRSRDDARLAAALQAAGATVKPGYGGLEVNGPPEAVGDVALAAAVALVELRSSGTNQLEDLFLSLTADTARDQPQPPPPTGPPLGSSTMAAPPPPPPPAPMPGGTGR